MIRQLFYVDNDVFIYEREQPGLFYAFSDYYWGDKNADRLVGPFTNIGTAIRDYERFKSLMSQNPNVIQVDFKSRVRMPGVK